MSRYRGATAYLYRCAHVDLCCRIQHQVAACEGDDRLLPAMRQDPPAIDRHLRASITRHAYHDRQTSSGSSRGGKHVLRARALASSASLRSLRAGPFSPFNLTIHLASYAYRLLEQPRYLRKKGWADGKRKRNESYERISRRAICVFFALSYSPFSSSTSQAQAEQARTTLIELQESSKTQLQELEASRAECEALRESLAVEVKALQESSTKEHGEAQQTIEQLTHDLTAATQRCEELNAQLLAQMADQVMRGNMCFALASANPFPPSTPQVILSAARAALKFE
jgi:hypothetical protein